MVLTSIEGRQLIPRPAWTHPTIISQACPAYRMGLRDRKTPSLLKALEANAVAHLHPVMDGRFVDPFQSGRATVLGGAAEISVGTDKVKMHSRNGGVLYIDFSCRCWLDSCGVSRYISSWRNNFHAADVKQIGLNVPPFEGGPTPA